MLTLNIALAIALIASCVIHNVDASSLSPSAVSVHAGDSMIGAALTPVQPYDEIDVDIIGQGIFSDDLPYFVPYMVRYPAVNNQTYVVQIRQCYQSDCGPWVTPITSPVTPLPGLGNVPSPINQYSLSTVIGNDGNTTVIVSFTMPSDNGSPIQGCNLLLMDTNLKLLAQYTSPTSPIVAYAIPTTSALQASLACRNTLGYGTPVGFTAQAFGVTTTPASSSSSSFSFTSATGIGIMAGVGVGILMLFLCLSGGCGSKKPTKS